jgi:hypothetical protein
LRKIASAILEHKEGWYGISFSVREKELTDVKLYTGYTIDELKKLFEMRPCGVALDNSSGYLFSLAFPFSGRRKIGLVLGGELAGRLPFPIDETITDFVELGPEGKVLAAVVPRGAVAELTSKRNSNHVTLQSLAVLRALRWFKLLPMGPLVYINCFGNTAVIMTFSEGRLVHLRQFFRSLNSTALTDAVQAVAADADFYGATYIMVGDDDAVVEKETIEHALGITVRFPAVNDYILEEALPPWSWAAIGAALIALDPKGELNLSGERYRTFGGPARLGFYASGALAGVGLLVLGLSFLDLQLKGQALTYLSGEPARIYRTAFPKAPPVKDVGRAFEDRIKKLEREGGPAAENPGDPLALLNEISSKLDVGVDVKLSEFTADDKEFAIAGTTVSFAAVDKIKAGLEQLKGATGIELQTVDMASAGQIRFRFRGKL